MTGYQPLNADMAKALFELISTEPWGIEHLRRVQHKLSLAGNPKKGLASLDQSERWFFGHMLTSWVTGIYYHNSGNIMVSYEHALMHASFKDIRPTPGLSSEEFGFWSKPPSSAEKIY